MKRPYTFFLVIVFLFSFAQNVLAQSAPMTPSATNEAKFMNVSYDLPYPGILPDSPLYFLKALRDNVINLFITDQIKKADYDLLMADKRLASSASLLNKGNYQLAITTLSKSGNYFDQAIQLAAQGGTKGKDVKFTLDKLWVASQKHQQVIFQMSQKTKGDVKYNLELLQVRAKSFQDTVDVVRSQ